MINKIKHFLKNKLSRSSAEKTSDENEYIDDQLSESDLNEGFDQEDKTGEISLHHLAHKSSWKDKFKFKIKIPRFQKAQEKTLVEKIPSELSSSWRDKFGEKLNDYKSKIGGINAKEWKIPEGFKYKKGAGTALLSPSLTKSIEKFLSRQARESIHQVFLVTIICGITYTLGKVTALVLKGPPAADSARDYSVTIDLENDFQSGTLAQVKSINIFRTNTGLLTKKNVADTKCEEAQQESSLPIKLVNTIVLQDKIKSLASVQVRGERALQEMREGDQIQDMAKIFKITRLEILIKNLVSGTCESITSDKAREARSPISVMSPSESKKFLATKKMSGIDNIGNKFLISKVLLDEKMKDIGSILTQTRAVKIQNPDGSLSFKLTEMDPQGIFPYLGLQDQDIITSINGKQIYDMNEVMSMFAKIKNLDNLQLGVKREGSDSVQEYSIKK